MRVRVRIGIRVRVRVRLRVRVRVRVGMHASEAGVPSEAEGVGRLHDDATEELHAEHLLGGRG